MKMSRETAIVTLQLLLLRTVNEMSMLTDKDAINGAELVGYALILAIDTLENCDHPNTLEEIIKKSKEN